MSGRLGLVVALGAGALLGVAGCDREPAPAAAAPSTFALSIDDGPTTEVPVGTLGPEGRSLLELLPPEARSVSEWKGIMVEVRDGAHRLLVEPERSHPGARYRVVPCEAGLGIVVRPAPPAADAPEHVRRALERPVFEACGVARVVLATRHAAPRPAEAEPTLAVVVDGRDHPVPLSRIEAASQRGGGGGRDPGASGAPLALLLPTGVAPESVTTIVAHTGDGARLEVAVDDAFADPPRLGLRLNRRGLLKIELAGGEDGRPEGAEPGRRASSSLARDVVRIEVATRPASGPPSP